MFRLKAIDSSIKAVYHKIRAILAQFCHKIMVILAFFCHKIKAILTEFCNKIRAIFILPFLLNRLRKFSCFLRGTVV